MIAVRLRDLRRGRGAMRELGGPQRPKSNAAIGEETEPDAIRSA